MAKKQHSDKVKDSLSKQFSSAQDAVRPVRETWNEREEMLIGKVVGKNPTANKVSEGSLASIVWERAARVMSQLPTGKINALTLKDKGKNALMNIILNRYIQPNANAQFSHLTKLRMWDLYSMVYGTMPMMYDYRVDDEYIGPDCWLINPRNFFPQPGKINIKDCEWVMVSTFVSKSYLENKKNSKTWNSAAIKRILDEIEDGAKPGAKDQYERKSAVENDRTDDHFGDTAEVELVTKYERGKKGRWITFCPDYDNEIVRDIENPHQSGKIPIVLKYAFPLLDSVWGLSDFERGASLQKGIDTLVNMYLAGEKLRIAPPIKIDSSRVTAHTIRFKPNAKWDMRDMNAVQPYMTSPQGVNGFQAGYSFMKSALLNQNGTTDTMINEDVSGNPSFGKTPAALKQQAMRESTRDNWDRFFMEQAVEELYEGLINLLASKQEKPINIEIFDEEIQQIADSGMEDVLEVYESGLFGKVTIAKKHIKAQYRYEIDANSTLAKDDAEEHEGLTEILSIALKVGPEAMNQMLASSDRSFDMGELWKRWLITGGTKDWEKILPEVSEEDQMQGMAQNPEAQAQQQQMMAEQQAMQQAQAIQQQNAQALQQMQDPEIRQIAEQIMRGGQ